MVSKLLSLGLVGGVAVVSACFGDGPTPTAPSGATVLFSTSPGQRCNEGTFIGPVAFGSDHVYVSFLPYQPVGGNCNGGGGGGGNTQAAQSVFQYPLAGGTLEKVGSAGSTDFGGHVQLAATGSGVAYVYSDPSSTTPGLFVEPGHITLPSTMGTIIALGMFAVGSDLYVATVANGMTTGALDVTGPNFPNGGGGSINAASGDIVHVGSGAVGTWTPSCGSLDHCFVGNSTSYAYVSSETNSGGVWNILQVPLGGTTPAKLATEPQSGGVAPLGLDIDETHVAWSMTESCVQPMGGGDFNCNMHTCTVSVYDTGTQMTKTLLSTQEFACIDAKLANGYVYFAIVTVSSENNQMIGRGIGRVSIADRTVETLDLGIKTTTAGPHRIFPIGDQLYLVDPFVMARIDASALDGKHDFMP